MTNVSYISSYFHCVFSTKERRPLITPELRQRLWPFLGGIARQNDMKAIELGGMPDHVHILLSLPSTLSVVKALQLIKGGSCCGSEAQPSLRDSGRYSRSTQR